MTIEAKYRFLFIQPFRIATSSEYLTWTVEGTREERLMTTRTLVRAAILEDVEWDIHPGPQAPYGDWPVENREEFALVAAGVCRSWSRQPRAATWDALILLGGGEPGADAAHEIWQETRYAGHFVCHLGQAYCLDARQQIQCYRPRRQPQHVLLQRDCSGQDDDRCASIRTIDYPIGRPGHDDENSLASDKAKALAGE